MKTSHFLGAGLVALCAGSAQAQSQFNLRIGGDYFFESGFVSESHKGNLRSTEFRERFRLTFAPTAKADNGLEYGSYLRVRFVAAGSNDYDRAYMFARGRFGELRAGTVPSFDDEVNFPLSGQPTGWMPYAITNYALSWLTPLATGSNGRYYGADTAGGISGALAIAGPLWTNLIAERNGSKLLYMSPRMAGLQIGATYTPQSTSGGLSVDRAKNGSPAGAQVTTVFRDLAEIGANYIANIGPVQISAAGAIMHGQAATSTSTADRYNDYTGWSARARVKYDILSVGGNYTYLGDSGQNRLFAYTGKTYNWHLGAQIAPGPWVFGAAYIYGEDPGQTSLPGSRKFKVHELGAGYNVAPGLMLQASYDYVIVDSDRVATAVTGSPNSKANVVTLRTTLTF